MVKSSNLSAIHIWNSRIRHSVDQKKAQNALSLFRQMKANAIHPNNLTFPFIVKACAKLFDVKYAQIIHTHIIKSPFYMDMFVQTAMVDMYVKCGRIDMAHNLFVKMPKRDVTAWNAMLVGFAQLGFSDRVFGMFQEMELAGFLPDSVTVMGISQAVSCMKSLDSAKCVHSFGIRIGVDADVSVANTWISMYTKCGDLGSAESVFDGIDATFRSVVSWNSMIEGYADFEKCFDALNSYKWMLEDGFSPDTHTIVSLLSSCVQPEALFLGMLIHSHGIRFGCVSDIRVLNTIISMYSKCGDVDAARCLFDRMHHRSCVSWTAIISGYAEKGDMDQALSLFSAMEATGEKPDLVTVLSVVSGCGQAGILEVGRCIDAYAESNKLKHNVVVCNALIDMYAKCGSISHAREIFYAMPNRTVVSWTTMIAGCALNGLFKEALDLFHQMVEVGLKPNHITYLSVLQACTHAGFLEKGWEYFNMMTKEYKINPGLDHCSCMVDLLGRRGKLKQALEFILSMPFKPDAAIWSALLGACKIHRNIEVGEFAAQRLLELEPQIAVPYVEMANIYASVGKWNEVARMRTMMNCNNVRKAPGQSLIEVNGKAHAFTVEDRSHFEGELIYTVLDTLLLQSKEEKSAQHSDEVQEWELQAGAGYL